MKHLFSSIIFLAIVIIGFFSIRFLIYGFPKSIENSRFNPTIPVNSENSPESCENGDSLDADIVQNSNEYSSLNYQFSFKAPIDLNYVKTTNDDVLHGIMFKQEKPRFTLGLSFAKTSEYCINQARAEYDHLDTKEKVLAHAIENRGDSVAKLMDPKTINILGYKHFIKSGNSYFQYSYSSKLNTKDIEAPLNETVVVIFKGKFMYILFFGVISSDPIPDANVNDVIDGLSFN